MINGCSYTVQSTMKASEGRQFSPHRKALLRGGFIIFGIVVCALQCTEKMGDSLSVLLACKHALLHSKSRYECTYSNNKLDFILNKLMQIILACPESIYGSSLLTAPAQKISCCFSYA